jgi:hypothetical protein
MKNWIVISPLVALFFAGCSGTKTPKAKADITKDTLTYTYQKVLQKAADCGNKKDTAGCSMADISYPVFSKQTQLTDTVTRRMLRLFDADPDKDFETQAKNFVASYDAWIKKMKKKPESPFKLNEYARVLRQDSDIITIEIGGSSFGGSKHPVSLVKFINWDTKAGKDINLSDILVSGYKNKLDAIAEKIFRKQENLKDTSSLARDYFFKGAKFSLNDNYLISPVGLRFLYNVYEIKPFAAGTTDVYIPYGEIKDLLKPGTVVKQYIKP